MLQRYLNRIIHITLFGHCATESLHSVATVRGLLIHRRVRGLCGTPMFHPYLMQIHYYADAVIARAMEFILLSRLSEREVMTTGNFPPTIIPALRACPNMNSVL